MKAILIAVANIGLILFVLWFVFIMFFGFMDFNFKEPNKEKSKKD